MTYYALYYAIIYNLSRNKLCFFKTFNQFFVNESINFTDIKTLSFIKQNQKQTLQEP